MYLFFSRTDMAVDIAKNEWNTALDEVIVALHTYRTIKSRSNDLESDSGDDSPMRNKKRHLRDLDERLQNLIESLQHFLQVLTSYDYQIDAFVTRRDHELRDVKFTLANVKHPQVRSLSDRIFKNILRYSRVKLK
jgi:hypothetical protein